MSREITDEKMVKNFCSIPVNKQKELKKLVDKFNLWLCNSSEIEDVFYDKNKILPISEMFNSNSLSLSKKEIEKLYNKTGTTKNKFSIGEINFNNAREMIQFSDFFSKMGFKIILCAYFGGFTYDFLFEIQIKGL